MAVGHVVSNAVHEKLEGGVSSCAPRRLATNGERGGTKNTVRFDTQGEPFMDMRTANVTKSKAMKKTFSVAAVVAGVALLAAACGSSTSSSSSTTMNPTPSTTATTTPSAPVGAEASNVPADAATKADLLAAGAAYNNLQASDYTGLGAGSTYVAEVGSTGYSYAGAHLIPSSSSTAAQIASQDAGSYLIYDRAPGGSWKVIAATGSMATCPANTPPASVVAVWGWPAGSCRPTSY